MISNSVFYFFAESVTHGIMNEEKVSRICTAVVMERSQ